MLLGFVAVWRSLASVDEDLLERSLIYMHTLVC